MEQSRRVFVDISSATIFRVLFILLAFAALYYIRDVVIILFVAMVLAAAMDPFADRLQRARLPRGLAVIVVYVCLVALLALIVALIIPPVTQQATQLSERFPDVISRFSEQFEALRGFSIKYQLGERLGEAFDIFGSGASRFSPSSEAGVLAQTLNIFGGFASFFIILVISFYFTVSEGSIKKFLRLLTPAKHEHYAIDLFERIQLKLARWVRGQLTLAVIMGVTVGVVLKIMGIPYALIFGLLAGLMEFIPVVGPVVAAIPAVIVAFFVSPLLGLGTIVFYVVLQQIENHILVPKIMQKAVGLHPVIVIISMLIGAKVAGVLGILLAVPVATIVSVFFGDFLGSRQDKEDDENATSPIV